MEEQTIPSMSEIIKASKKRNGFSKKPDWVQILGYLIFTELLFTQFVVVVPSFRYIIAQIASSGIVLLASGMLGQKSLELSLDDPTDPNTLITFYPRARGTDYEPDDLEFFCNICVSCVGNDTKHCRLCNRCVQEFDHHCRWVNNCITKSNYPQFIQLLKRLIFYSCSIALTRIGALGILLIEEFDVGESPFAILSDSQTFYRVFLMIESLCLFALMVVSVKFYNYHMWLIRNNLSTFKHISETSSKPSLNQIQPTNPQSESGGKVPKLILKRSGTQKEEKQKRVNVKSQSIGGTKQGSENQITLQNPQPEQERMLSRSKVIIPRIKGNSEGKKGELVTIKSDKRAISSRKHDQDQP